MKDLEVKVNPKDFGLEEIKASEMVNGLKTTITEREFLKQSYSDVLNTFIEQQKEQLNLHGVGKSFYCFEESMNMQLKCNKECTYCKSIKIPQ